MKKILGSLVLFTVMVNAEGFVANIAQEEDLNGTPKPQNLEAKAPKVEAQKSKSGFFLGVEGSFGETTTNQSLNMIAGGTSFYYGSQTTKSLTFDGGLKLGYQHYFGEKQSFGIRIGVYGGVGTQIDLTFQRRQANQRRQVNQIQEDFKNTYLPIKAGIDFDVLWDFFEKENHTLGLNVGVGYRFNYHLSLKNTKNWISNAMIQPLLDKEFSNKIAHDLYPQIGFHYYYDQHQFELNYRFGGIVGSLDVGGNRDYFKTSETGGGMEESYFDTNFFNQSYLSFSYAYRF